MTIGFVTPVPLEKAYRLINDGPDVTTYNFFKLIYSGFIATVYMLESKVGTPKPQSPGDR